MSLTPTNLAASSSTTNGAGTGSIAVPNNSVIYVVVGVSYSTGANPAVMTLSGTLEALLDGGVLTEIANIEDFGSRRTLWVYRGINTTGSTQNGTILFTGTDAPGTAYQEHFWAVDLLEGIDTTTPNGTVVENSGTGTSGTVTVTGTPDAGDFVYATFAHTGAASAMTINGELSNELSQTGSGGNFRRLLTAYDSTPDGTPVPGVTWSGAEDWAGVAFIVNVGAGGGATQDLAGAAAAAATAAAQLAISKAMASAATASATTTADLTLLKSLLGAAAAAATATGDLALAKLLAGAATGAAAATGDLSTGAVGTITTEPLKNNTGTLLASETGAMAHVYSTAGALVVTKTGQTTNGAGVMVMTDALIVPSTEYRVVVVLGSGAEGMAKYTATA